MFELNKIRRKGFALTQVLLAIALGSIVAAGIVLHYHNVSRDQIYQSVTDSIVTNSEISLQKKAIGEPSTGIFNKNGYKISVDSGQATITAIDKGACSAISNTLKPRGNVTTANCNNSNPTANTIVFVPATTVAVQNASFILQPGTADPGANNAVNPADLSGVYTAAGTNVAAGSNGSTYHYDPTAPVTAPTMTGGNSGTIAAGSGTGASGTTPTPGSATGAAPLSCRYILANNAAYRTSSLGARATPCSAGYASTSNQTGTRTWSCPNPTAATNPVNTDTWTGGSCAIICVPYASQTSTASCSAGYNGVITNRQDSYCPAYTGSPAWGAPYQIGNTCVLALQPPRPITTWNIGIYGGYTFTMGSKPALNKCTLNSSFNSFVKWDASEGNPADYYNISISRNGVSLNYTITKAQITCSASCATPLAMTQAQALAMTPDTDWSQLEYDHIVQVGSSITIYPWMENMVASVSACNGGGCSINSKTVVDLAIYSNGQHDCQAQSGGAPAYPATAHPKGF